MRGEDYIAREARDTAARLSPTASPTEIYQEISLAIRRCLHAYRTQQEDPDRMHREWRNGLFTGVAITVVSGGSIGVFVSWIVR